MYKLEVGGDNIILIILIRGREEREEERDQERGGRKGGREKKGESLREIGKGWRERTSE